MSQKTAAVGAFSEAYHEVSNLHIYLAQPTGRDRYHSVSVKKNLKKVVFPSSTALIRTKTTTLHCKVQPAAGGNFEMCKGLKELEQTHKPKAPLHYYLFIHKGLK